MSHPPLHATMIAHGPYTTNNHANLYDWVEFQTATGEITRLLDLQVPHDLATGFQVGTQGAFGIATAPRLGINVLLAVKTADGHLYITDTSRRFMGLYFTSQYLFLLGTLPLVTLYGLLCAIPIALVLLIPCFMLLSGLDFIPGFTMAHSTEETVLTVGSIGVGLVSVTLGVGWQELARHPH